MKLLNEEQRVFLFSLESKKKRREFMLDCLIENVLGAEVKVLGFKLPPHATFIPSGNHIEDSINSGLKAFSIINEVMKEATERKEELLKFDMLEEKIQKIYSEYFLDINNHLCWIYNRLIEVHKVNPDFDYMHKLREIATSYNSENKYNKEDMRIAFYQGRRVKPRPVIEEDNNITYGTDKSFDDWFEEFKKDKNE